MPNRSTPMAEQHFPLTLPVLAAELPDIAIKLVTRIAYQRRPYRTCKTVVNRVTTLTTSERISRYIRRTRGQQRPNEEITG